MNTKKILIVEDDEDITDIMTMVLETENFTVDSVSNPLNALEKAESFQPDAILLDLTMPEMSGWELYKQIRENRKFSHIPVAIVTAKSEEFDAVVGLHLMRADAYITKPFGKQQLIDSVKELFAD
ncbi:MAG: response regulator transcription factor [Fibrobacterota bacterium]